MSNLRAVFCLSLGLLVAQAVYAKADASAIYRKYRDAVVTVRTKEKVGTGFVVGDGSLVMTCFHVITGYEAATVDKVGQAKVLVAYPQLDVAVLKLSKRMATRTAISKVKPGPGSKIYVIGNPLGFLERTISEGIVGANRHTNDGDYVQISAPISEGSSGSPVFDSKGNVIGMASASIEEGQNLNFAICGADLGIVFDTAKFESSKGTSGAVMWNYGGKKEAWQAGQIKSGTKVYAKPSKTAKSTSTLPKGEELPIASVEQTGWVKVILKDKKIGYVPVANVVRSSMLARVYQMWADDAKEDEKPAAKPPTKVESEDGAVGRALFNLFETDEDDEDLGDVLAPRGKGSVFHKGDTITGVYIDDQEDSPFFADWAKLRIYLDYCAGHTVTIEAMDSKAKDFYVQIVPKGDSEKAPLGEIPLFVQSWKHLSSEIIFGLFEPDEARKDGAVVGTLKLYSDDDYLFSAKELQPFRKGDQVVGITIAGDRRFSPVANWQDVRDFTSRFPTAPVLLDVRRGGEKFTVAILFGLGNRLLYTRGVETEVVYRGSSPTATASEILATTTVPDRGRISGTFVFSSAGEGSPFKSGDQILAVRDSKDGKWQPARDWGQLERALKPISNRPATFKVRRGTEILAVTLCQSDTPDSAVKRSAGEDFTYKSGSDDLVEAMKLIVPAENNWTGAFIGGSKDARLEDGDELVSIKVVGGDNSIPVTDWGQLTKTLDKLNGHSVVLEIRRRENTFKVTVELI